MYETTVICDDGKQFQIELDFIPNKGDILELSYKGEYRIDGLKYYFPLDHDKKCHAFVIYVHNIEGERNERI